MTSYKKITVIGGAGFVGTNFCQCLADHQIDFEIIDLKQSKRFPDKCKIGDVRKLASLRNTIAGDAVVNLAAVHRDDVRDKSEYFRTNVEGAENVAVVCAEKGINKIIFTSTVAVYGFAECGTDESGEINPFNEYGKTKFQAEEKFRAWQKSGDNNLTIVRPTVIFGEGNRGNVYNLLNQIASGKFLMIGAGENKKSMAYIGNITAFLHACLNSDKGYAVYNYVDTPDLTMNELVALVRAKLHGKEGTGIRIPYWLGLFLGYFADAIAKITAKSLPISSIRVKKFAASTQFATSKETLDAFVAPVSLSQGINNTLKSEFLEPDPDREIFFTE